MKISRKPGPEKKAASAKGRKGRPKGRKQKEAIVISDSYEEALLRSVLGKERVGEVSPRALLLAEILSGFTSRMREMSYTKGIGCGRTLFKIIGERRGYDQCGEYMPLFANFLGNAGYRDVTYQILPHRIIVQMKPPDGSNIRKKMHHFEAGMLCGFLNAASHRFAFVSEKSCTNEGGRECVIAYEPLREGNAGRGEDMWEAMKALAAKGSDEQGAAAVGGDYHALVMDSIPWDKYSDSMNTLMRKFGAEASVYAAGMKENSGDIAERIVRKAEMLGFGKADIKRADRRICLRFNRTLFRRGIKEMAEAFVEGMIGSRAIGIHLKKTRRGEELCLDYGRNGAGSKKGERRSRL
ncbi:MAG: hypothetical protein M1448_00520 [Candidatus Marsarchaeota archaeon]|nr:hypothetical protein [Candidatus Marsarchaeota archaeon]